MLNLRIIDLARSYGAKLGRLPGSRNEDRDQILCEMADQGVDHLNDLDLPPYCSFHVDDNSLYLTPNVDDARDSVDFVSREEIDETTDPEDSCYPCATFRGEWLHVSDHGNATLYVREDRPNDANGYIDREVWGVV